jgi:hypothetical protein
VTKKPREVNVRNDQPPRSPELPLLFRVLAIGLLVLTLVVHIFLDAFLDDYEGAATSLMLGGIVGTALGLNEFLRGRGSS